MYVCNLHSGGGGGGGQRRITCTRGGGRVLLPFFFVFFFLFPSADFRALPQKRRMPNRRLKATYHSN